MSAIKFEAARYHLLTDRPRRCCLSSLMLRPFVRGLREAASGSLQKLLRFY